MYSIYFEKDKGSKNARIDKVFWRKNVYLWVWSAHRDSSLACHFSFFSGDRRRFGRGTSLNGKGFAVRDYLRICNERKINRLTAGDAAKSSVIENGEKKETQQQEIKRSCDDRYEVSPEGVISDTKTGLQWYVGPDEKTTWDGANTWANKLAVAGGGWRLPTIDELDEICEKGKGSQYAHIDKIFWDKSNYLFVWSNEIEDCSALGFFFDNGGYTLCTNRKASPLDRAFAVRG